MPLIELDPPTVRPTSMITERPLTFGDGSILGPPRPLSSTTERPDLRLTWSAYDGSVIRLKQSKSIGKKRRIVRVEIPVGVPLKAALAAAAKAKKSPIILSNSDGRPWTADGF